MMKILLIINSMRITVITYITTSLLFLYGILAQRAFANDATPDPEIIQFPYILITEVGFKNSEQDTIVLQVVDDMNDGQGSKIKGLSLKDDSVFFKLDEDIYIKSGEKILISLKNDTQEILTVEDELKINLTKSGLTGTTEQLILLDGNNEVIDAVCWASSTPTATEIKELDDLFLKKGWDSKEITSCIDSDKIGTNQTVWRKNLIDTNSKEDWEIKIIEEPTTEEETGTITASDDITTADGTDGNMDEEEIDLEICADEIIISEFLPNPEGKDSGQEWIEIMNSSGAECSLYGWAIDDQEGGSKIYQIESTDLIPTGGYLLLPSWKTKLNLNNSEDSIRIFNQNNKLTDEVIYKSSPENKSYALNKNTGDFLWTSQLSPLMENIFDTEEAETDEDDDDNESSTSKKTTSTKKSTSKITNGTLSDYVYITEILPNPEGQDKGLEWIEIFNDSEDSVKLGNWKIETSSKTYIFENIIIEKQSYIVLSDADLGFSIKNSDETFTLKDFNDNEISSVQYEKVSEAKSFMEATNIEGENSTKYWTWTDKPTPGEKNYVTYTYTGEIENFDPIKSTLRILSEEENMDIQVLITGDELLDSIFTQGTKIKVKIKLENEKFILEEYEILEESKVENQKKDSNNLLYIIISSLPPIGFLGYSAVKKFGLIKIV
ncbi:hypothetical protein C0416_00020 [bacterium]|nr:hypothetical protein [bacterium]